VALLAIFGPDRGREELATKFGVTILVIVALAGCSRESVPGIPTAPAPPAPGPPAPPTGSAVLWVMVITETGRCIEGATIQTVLAGGAGDPIPQKTPCSAWDSEGGLLLTALTPGVPLTLRGAAPGYAPREKSFLPDSTPQMISAVSIELSKAQ